MFVFPLQVPSEVVDRRDKVENEVESGREGRDEASKARAVRTDEVRLRTKSMMADEDKAMKEDRVVHEALDMLPLFSPLWWGLPELPVSKCGPAEDQDAAFVRQ